MERRLTTILVADVVGYSRLMGEDESGTLEALKAHRADLIDPKAAQYGGRTIKLMGDGILMEFASVVDAVSFAVEIQHAMQTRNDGVSEARRVLYRVGINIRLACEQIGFWDMEQELSHRRVNACKIGCNLGQDHCL